jgi:hypothetical protein
MIIEEKERRFKSALPDRYDLRKIELVTQYSAFVDTLLWRPVNYPQTHELMALPAVEALLLEDDATIPVTSERFKDCFIEQVELAKQRADFNLLKICLGKPFEQLIQVYGIPGDDIEKRAVDEYGHILYRATCLFDVCSPSTDGRTIVHELGHYLDCTACLSDSAALAVMDPLIPQAMLKMVGLPEDALYSDISGKLVCTCGDPDFEQPATFAKLVRTKSIFPSTRHLQRIFSGGACVRCHFGL